MDWDSGAAKVELGWLTSSALRMVSELQQINSAYLSLTHTLLITFEFRAFLAHYYEITAWECGTELGLKCEAGKG